MKELVVNSLVGIFSKKKGAGEIREKKKEEPTETENFPPHLFFLTDEIIPEVFGFGKRTPPLR
ncbi:hypothetical protein AACA72_00040, partial [Enterococcus faecium]